MSNSLFGYPILVILVALPIVRFIYTALSNPLRHVPCAHPLASYTSLWISSVRYRHLENRTLKAAHEKLGPIICLGPQEISVNCIKGGIRDVYAGGFEKGGVDGTGNWYSFFANYGGVDNMFSLAGNKAHSIRKRMISNIYSKSVINSSKTLQAQTSVLIYGRFLPLLASKMAEHHPADLQGVLDIYSLLSAATMDFVTAYLYGLTNSSNLLERPEELKWFLDLYRSRHGYTFWPQEFPQLTAWLERWLKYSPVPSFVPIANQNIEDWTMDMCNRAEVATKQGELQLQDTPVVFQQLTSAVRKDSKTDDTSPNDKRAVASECLDHLAAGFDTSSITLAYLVHELCLHPELQTELRHELLTLSPQLVPSSAPSVPDAKAVDALPLLHAVVWETLRLHAAIPGPQPRVTPPRGCHLGQEGKSFFIPGGVRVSASAGILHSNEAVYEHASEWLPKRWLDLEGMDEEKRRDMESRWFWAFGSGGRMCVGSHLAVFRKSCPPPVIPNSEQCMILLPFQDEVHARQDRLSSIQTRRVRSTDTMPEMKHIVAALYSNYTTSIVDDGGMQHKDAYTAPPVGEKLVIRLSSVQNK